MLVAFYMPRTCTLLSALSHSAFIVTLSLSPSPQWSKAVPPPLSLLRATSQRGGAALHLSAYAPFCGTHAVTPLNPAQPDDASFVRAFRPTPRLPTPKREEEDNCSSAVCIESDIT